MLKLRRMHEMSKLEQSIMVMIWTDVKELPVYENYRNYERSFTYENKRYRYKCKYKIEDGHLSIIDDYIEHEQVVIDLH